MVIEDQTKSYLSGSYMADSGRFQFTNQFVRIEVASELGAFHPASPSAFNNHNFFELDGFEHKDRSIITYFINPRGVNF